MFKILTAITIFISGLFGQNQTTTVTPIVSPTPIISVAPTAPISPTVPPISTIPENSVITPPPALIECTGPDGKQFQATQADCDKFNAAWAKPISQGNASTVTTPPTSNTVSVCQGGNCSTQSVSAQSSCPQGSLTCAAIHK